MYLRGKLPNLFAVGVVTTLNDDNTRDSQARVDGPYRNVMVWMSLSRFPGAADEACSQDESYNNMLQVGLQGEFAAFLSDLIDGRTIIALSSLPPHTKPLEHCNMKTTPLFTVSGWPTMSSAEFERGGLIPTTGVSRTTMRRWSAT